jgi:hypothetical protein
LKKCAKKIIKVLRVLHSSVAKGPKFRPQNTKGAEKNCVGPEKSGAEFLPDLTKKGRKGADLFLMFKTAKFLTEN